MEPADYTRFGLAYLKDGRGTTKELTRAVGHFCTAAALGDCDAQGVSV